MTVRQIKPRPHVRADGTTAWFFRIRVTDADGRVTQHKHTFATEDEALEGLRQIQVDLKNKKHVPPTKLTVKVLAEEWLATKGEKRPSTRQHYEHALRLLLERHGDLAVQKLDSKHLEALKRDMKSGKARVVGTPGKPLSPRTTNGNLQAIQAMLAYAVKKKYVADNQGTLVESVPMRKMHRESWEPEEAVAFLDYVREHDSWWFGAWLLTLYGLRRGEVLGLRWSDVDLDGSLARKRKMSGPSIHIAESRSYTGGRVTTGPTKTEASERKLPLTSEMVQALRAMRDHQVVRAIELDGAWTSAGLVVVDTVGRPVHPEAYSDAWLRLGKAAGLPRIVLHAARHTAASLMADQGVPIVVVAAILGQSQVSVTESYQHALRGGMDAAASTLGRVLHGGTN